MTADLAMETLSARLRCGFSDRWLCTARCSGVAAETGQYQQPQEHEEAAVSSR